MVLLRQRPLKGLLGGLWEFPNWKIEEKRRLSLRLRNFIKKEMGINVEVKDSIGTFKQTFSHFKLTLHVYHCQATDGSKNGRWIPIKDLPLLPCQAFIVRSPTPSYLIGIDNPPFRFLLSFHLW